jgi:hypothetical protein
MSEKLAIFIWGVITGIAFLGVARIVYDLIF